jgi:putative transposase
VNGERFEERFENNLKNGGKEKPIIMDRAGFHRKKQLGEACKKHGVNLLHLPPYSPDCNPVKKTWANMKRELRSAAPLHGLIETAIYAYLG